MSDLLADNADALAWIAGAKSSYAKNPIFGTIKSAVIWSDAMGPDGQPLVPIDPFEVAADINANGYPLLKGHDPGHLLGRLLSASVFTSSGGHKFIAAILGFYDGAARLSFRDLGINLAPAVLPPTELPVLPEECRISFATDPREIEPAWAEELLSTVPISVERAELSHNAADTLLELIRVGMPYVLLVWNPFVTTIATEAGKDTYACMHRWLARLIEKLADLRNPVVELASQHDGCRIAFILRGTNVKRNYAALEALSLSAAQAANLVANMRTRGFVPKSIVYEYHREDDIWYPSNAELYDGRFVSETNILIAIERLPSGLSLGITRTGKEPHLPSLK